MRWIHAVAAAVAATGIVGSVAQATLTVSLVPVAIEFGCNSRLMPTLNNARSFDLKVTQTGETWNVTTMQINLSRVLVAASVASFYTPTGHSDFQNYSLAPISEHENLSYDTGVTTPMFENTNDGANVDVLGSSDYPNATVRATSRRSRAAR